MSKTLEGMEERMKKIEINMVTMDNKIGLTGENIAKIELNMERNTAEMEKNFADMQGKLEAVNHEVRGLKAALIEGFDQVKEVLVKMEDIKVENTRKVRPGASGDKENIFVAGGCGRNSVEIFNWRQKSWSPLQPMSKTRYGATSFVYNNHVTIAGGVLSGFQYVNDMMRMKCDPNPDLSGFWSECPVTLPAKLAYHSSVLYNDQLIVTGGDSGNLGAISDCIDEVQLVPPYAVKTLSRMPEPRRFHGTEIFDENILIVGGHTTGMYRDNLKSVVLYDIKKNECKQLAPLPYEVSNMATVRMGDNIVVIGGVNKHGKPLDTVIMYNVKTEQSHMLPPMRCKRYGCAAVVFGNNIVVLGGKDKRDHDQKSVEAFNFDSNTWNNLPEMSEVRRQHTAVLV